MKKILFTIGLSIFLFGCVDKNQDYLVKIKTSIGTMTVLLYEETPLHKENFLSLAKSGKYDSTLFHRIINDYIIQGGNFYEKTGAVEPESLRVPAEIVDGFYHTKGALAAARQNDQVNPKKLSSSCQFYIVDGIPWEILNLDQELLNKKISIMLNDTMHSELRDRFVALQQKGDVAGMNALAIENRKLVEKTFGISLKKQADTHNDEAYENTGAGIPHLDKGYTIFGRVVEGIDIIDKIATVKTKPNNRPVTPIYISMEVFSMKKKEITDKYGYVYPKQ